MAYQAIAHQKSKGLIHIWDDKVGKISVPYKPYAYKKNSNGKYTTLDGSKVDKVFSWDDADLQRNLIYESDINPETRTLIDMYYESDEPSVGHRELFLDIEVSTEGGFSSAEDAWQPLTSIALHDRVGKRSIAIIVDKERKLQSYTDSDLILEIVSSELDLIIKFLQYYLEINPTIITGWNIDYFDIPYLYNRITKIAGSQYADSLSPIGEVVYLKYQKRYRIMGVSCLDYMALYKLFTYSEEVSYSLDAISKKELGKGKIEYEGTLDHLYRTDPEKFVKYNVNDVILVLELDEKLKFLALARGICHKGHVPYEDVYFTTRYLDGACITYMKRLGIIAPNRKVMRSQVEEGEEDHSNDFAGAFVKDPIPGLYEWVFDEDLEALYPNVMRTLNISPETKVGRISNWDSIKEDFWNENYSSAKATIASGIKHQIVPLMELREWLTSNNYSISSIGVVYDVSHQGLVPSILETWSGERKEYRALATKFGKEGNEEQSKFFDSRQHTMKIVSNSLYGALGAPGFRFHDLDNAESITLSGRDVAKRGMDVGNDWFVKQTGVSKDYVIYSDTDSMFFSAVPVIEMLEKNTGQEMNVDQKATITFKTSKIIETVINDSFTEFAKNHFNVTKHFFNIKQEYVATAGFWIAKKRYAQKIISEKGVSIKEMTEGKKEWKLDVKGMDVVRSSFPKAFREFMSGILIDILDKTPKKVIDDKVIALREDMKTKPMLDIMSPTGVKEVSKWESKKVKGQVFGQRMSGTPIHVKSALNYNDLLSYFNTNTQTIKDGEKIKWVYLRQNSFGLDTCALKGFEDPTEIVKFIENHIDYERIFDSTLKNKLGDFYSALNWGNVPKDNNIDAFFSF